tara:strand:- start:1185 stop:1688 length:504 start_codon:yes stop_codon:yes gene_type:complete
MTIKMIIATDCNFGIGKDNKLPWNCPEDLQYFKESTLNGCVVMGRKTYESLPFENGLPRRKNIVLSRTTVKSYMSQDVVWFSDKRNILELYHTLVLPFEDVWIVGGASVYSELLPHVEEIHHTIIDGEYDCDTFFDMSFLEDWVLHESFSLSDKATLNIWRRNNGKS